MALKFQEAKWLSTTPYGRCTIFGLHWIRVIQNAVDQNPPQHRKEQKLQE